ESTEEETDSEITPLIVQPGTFIARDGTKWTSSKPVQARRRASVNIVEKQPGLTMKAREISRPADAFNCFIDDEMVEIICHETNRYALHKGEQGTWIDVTPIEIRAFFGLLLLAGCYHGRKEPVLDMWSEENH
ncbi:PiggyBac transposable element-derived protein 1, partial [Trichinella zimbabwensis]